MPTSSSELTSSAHHESGAPTRTCIGCRERASWSLLERIVVVEVGGSYAVEFDHKRRRPGRGAWLHPTPECRQQAVRRKAISRALRIQQAIDVSVLLEP